MELVALPMLLLFMRESRGIAREALLLVISCGFSMITFIAFINASITTLALRTAGFVFELRSRTVRQTARDSCAAESGGLELASRTWIVAAT